MNRFFARGPLCAAFFTHFSLVVALHAAPVALAQFLADAGATSPTTLPPSPASTTPTAIPGTIKSGTRVAFLLSSAPPARARLALFEAGRAPVAASIAGEVRRETRDWTRLADGRWQTNVQIEVAPGRYELRLLTDDKARTALPFAPASLEVSGVARSAGWWLPGGSPFIRNAEKTDTNPAGRPLFIPNLKRVTGKKFDARDVALAGELPWKTYRLSIPAAAWQPNFDATEWRTQFKKGIDASRAAGESGVFGVSLSAETPPTNASSADAARVMTLVRSVVDGAAPEAALIFEARVSSLRLEFDLVAQSLAARCDAIYLSTYMADLDDILWATKAARRVAEEQPFYDVPIFVEMPPTQIYAQPLRWSDTAQLDLLFAGATGLVRNEASNRLRSDAAKSNDSLLQRTFERNRSLLVGSVTLEDIGVLPSPDGDSLSSNSSLGQQRLYNILRDAGRIPLFARADGEQPESYMIALSDRISDATIRTLRQNVERGARIYIEGAPFQNEKGDNVGFRLKELVGADAKRTNAGQNTMVLQDGWTFGTGRGTRVQVNQSVDVTLSKPTMSSQTKERKGEFRPLSSRAAATLADGSPALVINPVGKGEIVWMPHRIATSRVFAWSDLREKSLLNLPSKTRLSPDDVYYSAVAAYVQPGLVSLRNAAASDVDFASATNVRVAIRRSPKGALLLALLNSGDNPARVAATVDGAAGIALDLETGAALPLEVRGFASEATVTIPANGWKLVAFATTRAELDAERLAPLSRASLK
ncbi:MAG TPA: hypothetical protein VF681_07830 [Abditibacteriaceae bacterium]|jgi:hypothetical protein